MTPTWIELDDELRGTDVDAQDYADRTGLVVVEDADAAVAGPCWFGTRAAPHEARADYIAGGGTITRIYIPRGRA